MLIVLHARAEEADFLRRTGLTFLEDSQLLIEDLLNPPPAAAPTSDTSLMNTVI